MIVPTPALPEEIKHFIIAADLVPLENGKPNAEVFFNNPVEQFARLFLIAAEIVINDKKYLIDFFSLLDILYDTVDIAVAVDSLEKLLGRAEFTPELASPGRL